MEELNQAIYRWVAGFAHRSFILDDLVSFVAVYFVYFLVIAACWFMFSRRNWKLGWLLLAELLLAVILGRGVVTEFVQFFYEHPRPFDAWGFAPLIGESGNSFPSGHAALLFAIATVIWYWDKKWGGSFFVLSLLVGAARVFAGVHWPFDIAGGIVVGVLSAAFIHRLLAPARAALSPSEPSPESDLSSAPPS